MPVLRVILTFSGPPVDGLDRLREIPVNSQDEKCLRQIHSWMSECAEHEACYQSKTVPLPMRVIEISPDPAVAPQIILSDGKVGAYLILSHHYSRDAEVPDLGALQESSLPATLDVTKFPKAVYDAVDIARRLGFQYLWTRDLCTPKGEWPGDSFNILRIYGQAALMLAASAGQDAGHGIFHDRQILCSPALGTAKDRYFRPRVLRWMTDIEESPLAVRGWEVMERMLAPRIVHFTKRQMIWECASGRQFEAARIVGDQGPGPVANAYDKSVIHKYFHGALQRHLEDASKNKASLWGSINNDDDDDDAMKAKVARLESWFLCVSAFSWGSFDTPSDRLHAMGVVASAINDGTMGDYLAGVWSNYIVSGLFWGRMFSLLTPAPEYRAPSWSWASVDGHVGVNSRTWSKGLVLGCAPDPPWNNKYQPKLISHHMLLVDPSNPYGRVLEGSHILLEAACIGFQRLTKALGNQQQAFQINPVLDQSLMFDCGCCRPRPQEVQEAESTKFNDEIEHHICMVVQGNSWTTDKTSNPEEEGFCDLLILKGSDEDDFFTRVGYLRVCLNSWTNPVDPNGTFDALGWERRVLKLI